MLPGTSGHLEKVLILAFEDSEDAAKMPYTQAKMSYRATLNPENYSINHKVDYGTSAPITGETGEKLRYFRTYSDTLKLDFLFDATGVIQDSSGLSKEIGVFAEVEYFKNVILGFQEESHSTYYLVLIWGTFLFTCCATDMTVNYKLFNPNGIPIRAVATVNFKQSTGNAFQQAKWRRSSPDLTHIIKVKAGDTLPLLCKRVYGNPKYYLQIAKANGLGNFRQLSPGMELVFPPIDKTKN